MNPITIQKNKLSMLETLVADIDRKQYEAALSLAKNTMMTNNKAESEAAVDMLNDLRTKAVIHSDQKLKDKKAEKAKILRHKIEACRTINNPKECIDDLFTSTRNNIVEELEDLMPLYDSICYSEGDHCMRMTTKICKKFECGLCVEKDSEEDKCIKKCPSIKGLMNDDIKCTNKCDNCEKQKDSCLQFYKNDNNKNFICDQPCFPCIGCKENKLSQIHRCKQACRKGGDASKYEERCIGYKTKIDSLYELCQKSPLCKENNNCRECKSLRKKKREINRCADDLQLAFKEKMKAYCQANCKGQEFSSSDECKEKCESASTPSKKYIEDYLLSLNLKLGLNSRSKSTLSNIIMTSKDSLSSHKEALESLNRRHKRISDTLDSITKSLESNQSKFKSLSDSLSESLLAKKKLEKELKDARMTGATKETLSKLSASISEIQSKLNEQSDEIAKLKTDINEQIDQVEKNEELKGNTEELLDKENISIAAEQQKIEKFQNLTNN